MRLRALRLTGLLAAALVGTGAPARGAELTPDQVVDLARRHFQAGSAYFEEARYDDAAREFRESYRLSPKTDLLYNVAQCFVRKGDAARAIEFYQQYLDVRAEAPDRPAVLRTMVELWRHVGRVIVKGAPAGTEIRVGGWPVGRAPLGGPVTVTAGKVRVEALTTDGSVRATEVSVQPEETVIAELPPMPIIVRERVIERVVDGSGPHWWRSRGGWALSTAGVAMGIAGIVVAAPVASDVAARGRTAPTETDWRAAQNDGRTVEILGVTTAVVGAGMLAAGLALFYREGRTLSPTRPPVALLPRITPSGAGLALTGSF